MEASPRRDVPHSAPVRRLSDPLATVGIEQIGRGGQPIVALPIEADARDDVVVVRGIAPRVSSELVAGERATASGQC
jgi:hypothetical protein